VPDPSNVQDYNRYLYVRGNPLKLVDVNGHEPIHHSNYPCGYQACILNGGQWMPAVAWSPEIYDRFYGEGSALGQDPLSLAEVHTALDVAGMVDPTGVCDAVNFCLYATQGDFTNAGISAAAVLPLGDLAKAARGLGSFSRAAEFGVKPYKELDEALGTGSSLFRHHIVEQRFAKVLGIGDTDTMLSVVLTKEEHQVFTNAWRRAIGYITDSNPFKTNTASKKDIWNAAQDIYKGYPDLLEAARKTIFGD
jgi:hypothetical protein